MPPDLSYDLERVIKTRAKIIHGMEKQQKGRTPDQQITQSYVCTDVFISERVEKSWRHDVICMLRRNVLQRTQCSSPAKHI